MFALAYVILPFSDTSPAVAIRASLARFQRGTTGTVPDEWLAFHDETGPLRDVWAAALTFTDHAQGLGIKGQDHALWLLDIDRVRGAMRQRGLVDWQVRFADTMDLDRFVTEYVRPRFVKTWERDPGTGAYGRHLNPLGRWDWWDLGGRFDGVIVGDPRYAAGRGTASVSSGPSTGRTILGNVQDALEGALNQVPAERFDVRSDRNVELAATLLTDARAGRGHAIPGALVLPPNAAQDRLRWLHDWPELEPADAIADLGLHPGAEWPAVAEAVYARFEDHWVAGVAYHL